MEIRKEIQEAIKNDKLVIFAGAGLSTQFGLPSWKKLVEDVIKETDNDDLKLYIPLLNNENIGMSPIEVLEKLKGEDKRIRKYIKNKFQISDGDLTLHRKLIELTTRIITTNYDNAFELASKNTLSPTVHTSTFNISEIEKDTKAYIFKLHGTYSEPDNCIIFKEDYQKVYENDSSSVEKLKSIFINKTILFIGFGFNDPDIELIFRNLDKCFDNNNKHYILTPDNDKFKQYPFLNNIKIDDYNQINDYIDSCLLYKNEIEASKPEASTNITKIGNERKKQKVAFLYPQCLDVDFKDATQIMSCFESIDIELHIGAFNKKTLLKIEEFDALIIVSKVFKTRLYLEDENLKSNLITIDEIFEVIPNDNIPIIFITNENIEHTKNHPSIYIASHKNSIIKKFIYKAFKNKDLCFSDCDNISVCLTSLFKEKIESGSFTKTSIYKNNRDLEFGKKCLTDVVGRIEEQAAIGLKAINIITTNKLLNIKASGGIGKTTLVKKIAYELYNRGYYQKGVNFKSCENIKSYADFEEALIEGFNLKNIVNFKEYLIENYSNQKIDLLVILDNFETVINTIKGLDLENVIELLKFATDYANIIITSRERISCDDFEDVYSLTQMTTDDALILFQKDYGVVKNQDEIKILRNDILEDLLNNNPLAIKLVTKSRPHFRHISELKELLTEHFFESTNEDFSNVFKDDADLNIERTRSLYQSINYSYTTLNKREKTAFELLSLFPDGISLNNFKKCFEKSNSSNNISDKELRELRNKSLIEDYNGTLQLQPIIRRFAMFQFSKQPQGMKKKYCLDAYSYNCFILEIINMISYKKSYSESLKFYTDFKHNLLNVLSYIPDIEIKENGIVPEKKYLLEYILGINKYIENNKCIESFKNKINRIKSYFSELPNAEKLIEVLYYRLDYYFQEFDHSYKELSKHLSIEEMENRIIENEEYTEKKYKDIISYLHSMEGYSIQYINFLVKNKFTDKYQESTFFYLGLPHNLSEVKDGFYYFEYELMFDRLDINRLKKYISSLYMEEHLEIMQCTYTLSKVEALEDETIKKMVVTNPYTKGLKELMLAFNSKPETKIKHFENALKNLFHIKYYYLEALYYFCIFLKGTNNDNYKKRLDEGLSLSEKYRYQYLNHLFENIEEDNKSAYNFSYSYYNIPELESYVNQYHCEWEEALNEEIC